MNAANAATAPVSGTTTGIEAGQTVTLVVTMPTGNAGP